MTAPKIVFAFLLLGFAVCWQVKSSCAYTISPNDEYDHQAKQQILVIAVGGFQVSPSDGVEIYSVTSNSHLKNSASLPASRVGHGSAIFNNSIYVGGGWNGSASTDTFWQYSITRNKWNTDLPNVPSTVFGSAAVELGGTIYVLGGETYRQPPKKFLKQVYAYETRSRTWHTLNTQIPQTSVLPCAVVKDNHLYYMPAGSLFRSSDGAKTWHKLSSPGESRIGAACVAVGHDAILLAGGGKDGRMLNSVEIYNITTDRWKTVASMSSVRLGGPAQLMLPSHENVLICGGAPKFHAPIKDCEIYDWQRDKWSAAPFSLNTPRFNFGLFVIQANV